VDLRRRVRFAANEACQYDSRRSQSHEYDAAYTWVMHRGTTRVWMRPRWMAAMNR